MQISSRSFPADGNIPRDFTCDGRNINPPLEIAGVPTEARSLAIVLDDLDAPRGRFVHWAVWDMNPGTGRIEEGRVPDGAIEGRTSAGRSGYHGPCPPPGAPHRYFFKLYALDDRLDLPRGAPISDLENGMRNHVVAYAELMGTYSH